MTTTEPGPTGPGPIGPGPATAAAGRPGPTLDGPIVHVVCTDAFAGVERYVATVAAGQADRGHEVVVLGGRGERLVPLLHPSGVRWIHAATPLEALRRLAAGRAVTGRGVHRRPAVVHAHMTAAELAAVAARPAHRAPVVTTRHFAQTRGSSASARAVGRYLTPRLAAQVAVSRFVADSVEGASVIAHPGTPDVAGRAGPADRDPVVLVAQRLEPEKRTDLALDAWQQSGLAAAGWRLVVAGDGQERPRLQAQAELLGVADSVDFLGARADVDALQRRAAILLAPRPDEAFGLSVVEAMAAGQPVVAAAGGGHLETVGAVPGAALYEPFDTRRAGRFLADLAADPDRRAAYGAALQGAQRERFSVARHVDTTLDLYREVRS